MATPKAAGCTVCDRLSEIFARKLEDHNRRLGLLINVLGVEKASEQTKESYAICLAARNTLQEHGRKHHGSG